MACAQLGSALAANISEQSSWITSPQNLLAIGFMDPLGCTSWFAVALTVSVVSIVLIWLLLLASYHSTRGPTREEFTLKQWVIVVCLTTTVLWCIEHQINPAVRDMGFIAIILIFAFFAIIIIIFKSIVVWYVLLSGDHDSL